MTGLDLVTRVLRLVGALAPGEVPDASEQQELLQMANDMLDTWAADRLMVYVIQRSVYVPTALKQVYTLGPGGDFNAPRPAKIDRASIFSLNNLNQPLELPIDYLTVAQWQQVPVKNVESALPVQVWDDQAFPLRNLSYWPIPNQQVWMGIYAWVALPQFPDLFTDLTFPPAYAEAIKYNLAVRAAPEFPPIDQSSFSIVVQLAQSALAQVKIINLPLIDLRCDPAVVSPKGQVYDWRSDTYVSK